MLHPPSRLARTFVVTLGAPMVFALFASSLGCKKIQEKMAEKVAEKAIETTTGGKVDIENGGKTVTIQGDKPGEEMTFGAAAKIPNDFPKDAPLYPGAKVVGSASATGSKGKQTFTVSFESNDSPQQIVSFYKGKVPANGKKFELDTGDGASLAYEANGKAYTVLTGKNKDKGTTSLVLTVAEK